MFVIQHGCVSLASLLVLSVVTRLIVDMPKTEERNAVELLNTGLREFKLEKSASTATERMQHIATAHAYVQASMLLTSVENIERRSGIDVVRLDRALRQAMQDILQKGSVKGGGQ